MDLLAELEAWVRTLSNESPPFDYEAGLDFHGLATNDARNFVKKFDERARLQAEMRANVEELHRSGARLIANANREYAQEADLD